MITAAFRVCFVSQFIDDREFERCVAGIAFFPSKFNGDLVFILKIFIVSFWVKIKDPGNIVMVYLICEVKICFGYHCIIWLLSESSDSSPML
jgi:hypothetical protein